MRKKGLSYSEIKERLGIGKSSLRYILRDIRLTPEQEERLRLKIRENARKLNARMTPGQRREASRKGGLSCQRKHGDRIKKNLSSPKRNGANVAYRHDELETKRRLEIFYGRALRKVPAAGRYIDFGDEEILIEHTTDFTKGVKDLVERFEDVLNSGDQRRRIAFIPFPKVRRSRRIEKLKVIGVEVHDIKELEEYPSVG